MLLAAVASLAAGLVMIPFVLVHLMGQVMGEGNSLTTPLDQLAADLSLGGIASVLLVLWLALPFAWVALALGLACTQKAKSRQAKLLGLSSVVLGSVSVAAYGLETGFLFFAPAALAYWSFIVSAGEPELSAPETATSAESDA